MNAIMHVCVCVFAYMHICVRSWMSLLCVCVCVYAYVGACVEMNKCMCAYV